MFPMAGVPVVQFALTQEKLQQTMDMGPAPIDIPAPAGWAQTQEGVQSNDPMAGLMSQTGPTEGAVYYYKTGDGRIYTPNSAQLGDRQLTMQAYTAESVSGIGKQLAGSPGALEPYEAGGGWFPPCKPRELEYYMGKALSPAEMFGVLKANLDSMTMLVRLLCYGIFFAGFMMIGGPLAVAPQIVPCVGEYIAGVAQCMVACVAAVFALGLWAFSTAIAWLFYNPVYGIALLVVAGAASYIGNNMVQKAKHEGGGGGGGAPNLGAPNLGFSKPQDEVPLV